MARLTIKDLENLTGIKAHTIRMWEQRYGFIKPCRSETNIRYYCTEELMMLQDVALLNKAGYRICRINELGKEELRKKAAGLVDAELHRDNLVNEMIRAMVDMDVEKFEDLLSGHSRDHGIERTVTRLIYPFLVKSRLLWQSGHLRGAGEQLVTQVLRQKLIVAMELTVPKMKQDKSVLLFLPEGDHLETGLLYSCYVFKCLGFETIYLGGNLPLDDLHNIILQKKPGQVFTHLVNEGKPFRFEKYLQQLSKLLPETEIIVSGRSVLPLAAETRNTSLITEVGELFFDAAALR